MPYMVNLLRKRAILAVGNATRESMTDFLHPITPVETWALDALGCVRRGEWQAAQFLLNTFEEADWDEHGDEDSPYRKDYLGYTIQSDGIITIDYETSEGVGQIALIPAKETS